MADPTPDGTEDVAERSWCDTYVLHFPGRKRRKRDDFDRGVGAEGYERGTGVAVPTHPRLRRPGDKDAAADPFEDED